MLNYRSACSCDIDDGVLSTAAGRRACGLARSQRSPLTRSRSRDPLVPDKFRDYEPRVVSISGVGCCIAGDLAPRS